MSTQPVADASSGDPPRRRRGGARTQEPAEPAPPEQPPVPARPAVSGLPRRERPRRPAPSEPFTAAAQFGADAEPAPPLPGRDASPASVDAARPWWAGSGPATDAATETTGATAWGLTSPGTPPFWQPGSGDSDMFKPADTGTPRVIDLSGDAAPEPSDALPRRRRRSAADADAAPIPARSLLAPDSAPFPAPSTDLLFGDARAADDPTEPATASPVSGTDIPGRPAPDEAPAAATPPRRGRRAASTPPDTPSTSTLRAVPGAPVPPERGVEDRVGDDEDSEDDPATEGLSVAEQAWDELTRAEGDPATAEVVAPDPVSQRAAIRSAGSADPAELAAVVVRQRRGRAGRNLPAAIGVGLVLGGAALASLVTRPEAFVALASIVVVLAGWELAQALAAKQLIVPVIPLAVGSLGMLVSAYVAGEEGLLVSFILTAFGILLWRIIDGLDGAVRDVAGGLFAAAYVPFLAGFSILMLAAPKGPERVIAFLLVVVASDTGGYVTGVLFGRRPLAPSISPRKSWEGFAGSLVASVGVGAAAVTYLLDGPWWGGAALGAAAAVTATMGDLAESLLKRDLQVKDMGSLLPGHGGLMDRLDSMLPTAPVAYLLLLVFVPIN